MADTNTETIEDIVAEKRRRADEIERDVAEKMKRGEMTSDQYARELVADIRKEADRLEAAWKREKAAIEADALAAGGLVEAMRQKKATAEKSSAVGDCAKLREALERVLSWLKRMNAEPLNSLAVSEFTPSYAVNRTAKSIIEDNEYHISQLTAVLDAPPRNCDVGTAQEQIGRFDAECLAIRKRNTIEPCAGCPCSSNGERTEDCQLYWAQMPYDAEGGAK